MNDEVAVSEVVDVPTPEDEVTAAPESVNEEVTPEKVETQKTFTQEELDAAISKRLAIAQRKWHREVAAKAIQPSVQPVETRPIEEYESPEAYADALAMQRAEQIIAQREEAKRREATLAEYQDREELARDKYEDFEQVAYNPNLPITSVMAQTIQHSDTGPDIAYYLGANPKEAARIASLPEFLQAKEIGKLEAKLVAEPFVRKTTSAPAPIKPVSSRSDAPRVMDTTDPRSIDSMSTSEWIEADRKRQIKAMQAQRS